MPATLVPSKGTAFLVEISAVYTAVTLLKSVAVTGRAGETYDVRVLDGNAVFARASTGFASPATINFEVYHDPDDTVHTKLSELSEVPANTNVKVTYADATPTSEIFAGVGFSYDITAAPTDGLSASGSVICSGVST